MKDPVGGKVQFPRVPGWYAFLMLFAVACGVPSTPDSESSNSATNSPIEGSRADSPSIENHSTSGDSGVKMQSEATPVNRTNSVEWSNDYLGVILYTDSMWTRMDATQESALKSNFLNQPEWATLFQLIAVYENRETSEFIALSEYTGTERWYADVEQRMFSLGNLYLDSDEDHSQNARIYRMHLKIQGFNWVRIIDERVGQRILQVDYFENANHTDPSWDWKSKASELQGQITPLGYY